MCVCVCDSDSQKAYSEVLEMILEPKVSPTALDMLQRELNRGLWGM